MILKKGCRIKLTDMRFHAFHGVFEQERVVGNTFVVNLDIQMDFLQAALTDELNATISYADLYEVVKEEMAKPSKLLENVAGRILNRLADEFEEIQDITLEVAKLNPPFGGDVKSASVVMEYVRKL
ncbi:dihydroneopterin aldolase [Falsiporphyromonas endometrii]|uniref:7,8-dihydroneopterin aldolase n=1 Tax=Falsiporphyromonas endometrii TaxID=1387297 RepID=A0ABV9K9P1_9PORP|nr:dihydroneopterin aldolase [Porphyromonadaceae bacterium]